MKEMKDEVHDIIKLTPIPVKSPISGDSDALPKYFRAINHPNISVSGFSQYLKLVTLY